MDDGNGNWVLAPDESEAIAVYNGKGYMSLKEALDAAGNGPATVSLVGNTTEAVTIPAGANITIDIAEGITLTGTASGHVITNNGTLTVTGEGTVKAIASNKGAVENFGTANLKGANFTRDVYPTGGNWYVLDNQGTMNISDTANVSAKAHDASLIRNLGKSLEQKATLNISGGTFNNAVPEEFCAENFHPNRNPDGSYSVHTHQFGPWVTTVRPGHTTSGTEVQTCTVCGYEIARTIAPTGNNDHPDIEQAKQDGTWGQEETSTPAPTATAAPASGSVNTVPQTGDEMPLAVLGGAAALAAAAMVVLILRKRRVF